MADFAARLAAHMYHAAGFATVIAAWGSLAGSHTTGTRRSPARASAPAARRTSPRAAGPTVRLDAPPTPRVHPSVEADTQPGPRATRAGAAALPNRGTAQGGPKLTATAGEDNPERPAAAVHQPGGAA